MAHTSVKITADADTYKAQMKTAVEEMKKLSSEYNLAATKAKLFGTETDSLKAKAESLTQKINVQNSIVKMSREEQERLTKKLEDQKAGREKLKTQIDAAQKAYEAEKKATGASSDASKALKEELDKLKDQYKTNESAISKTESALTKQTATANKAETELIEMEAELKNVNEQLENNKFDNFANDCQLAGEKAESFGNKMMGITTGIVAIAKESVKSFEELKEGYDIIVTKTGAAGEALDELKDSANNVFGRMPEDMSIVGEAIGEVNTRFHSTGEELEDLSTQFVQFASINGTQVTASVDQVDKIMRAWNMDASQTGNLLGILTAKAQETGISVDSLEKYVLDNNSAFKEMGLSLPQAINLMAQFDANGVDATTALAGLKKALQNATEEGKSMNVALKDTIGRIKNAKGDVEALQIATELFGKKGAAEMAAAIRENRIDLTALSSSIEEYGTIVEETYNGTKSPLDDAKTAMNNVKIALSELGDTMLTGAAPIIKELTGKIQELTKWFTSLDKGQQQTIIKIGLVVAAVGPLAVGFGKVAKGISSTVEMGKHFVSGAAAIIGKITGKTAATIADTAAETAAAAATSTHTTATMAATTATGGMTTAQAAFNMVLNACPIIAIVAGIVALVAAGVLLYQNWDTIKEKATELWKVIREKFGEIKEEITNAFNDAKEAADKKMKEIRKIIESTPVGKAAFKVFDGVRDTISKMSDAAAETVKQNLSNMEKAYKDNGGGIKGTVAATWEGIKGVYTSGFTFIDKLTDGTLSRVKEKFGSKMHGAYEKVKQAIDKIKDVFDFEWKLPDIKLPHFKVSGKFSLSPPSAPKFSIQWYKTGAIMNNPMIFGMYNNTLLAGGEPETGGEAILPLAPFYTKLNDMLDKKLAAVQQTQNIYLESRTYIDGEEISNRTVSKVDAKMVQNRRKGR